ncbi:MAG: hypothetical protein ACK5AS_01015 [Bacteroidota bacterium]|jgi:hypothetical protein
MKKMKIFSASSLSALALSTMLFFSACTTDPCKDVVCENDGTCNDGTCECIAGYEGDDCSTEMRTKFAGQYSVTDGCSASGAASYTINITSSSSDVSKVLISNFWNLFANNVVATVNGTNLTIANQEPDNDGYKVTGNGTINGNTLTINYTVIDPLGASDVCTAICNKQ